MQDGRVEMVIDDKDQIRALANAYVN
jgi:hypothetical protein